MKAVDVVLYTVVCAQFGGLGDIFMIEVEKSELGVGCMEERVH